MSTRIERLLAEAKDAYDGTPWYGSPLLKIVRDVDEARLREKPKIAELLAHLTAWIEIANRRVDGEQFEVTPVMDFPPVAGVAWNDQLARLDRAHRAFLDRIAALSDADLDRMVAGKQQTIEYLLRGVVQHNIYHEAQIALLKKG